MAVTGIDLECSPQVREYITRALMNFRNILANGRDREVREAYVQFSIYLEAVERHRFDFHGFDESFFDDDI